MPAAGDVIRHYGHFKCRGVDGTCEFAVPATSGVAAWALLLVVLFLEGTVAKPVSAVIAISADVGAALVLGLVSTATVVAVAIGGHLQCVGGRFLLLRLGVEEIRGLKSPKSFMKIFNCHLDMFRLAVDHLEDVVLLW